MEWDNNLEDGASLTASDIAKAVVGGVSIIGATVCALDKICQETRIFSHKEKSPAKATKSSQKAKSN